MGTNTNLIIMIGIAIGIIIGVLLLIALGKIPVF
jgi:hypothetical protein